MCQKMRPMSALEDFKDKRTREQRQLEVSREDCDHTRERHFLKKERTHRQRRDKDEKLTFQHPVLTIDMSQHSSDRE